MDGDSDVVLSIDVDRATPLSRRVRLAAILATPGCVLSWTMTQADAFEVAALLAAGEDCRRREAAADAAARAAGGAWWLRAEIEAQNAALRRLVLACAALAALAWAAVASGAA